MTSLSVLSSLSFVYGQRWLRVSLLGNKSGRGNKHWKNSILGFVCVVYLHRVNDRKFSPIFYSQDLLSFDSLSRDWILKLDPNDNFRN